MAEFRQFFGVKQPRQSFSAKLFILRTSPVLAHTGGFQPKHLLCLNTFT